MEDWEYQRTHVVPRGSCKGNTGDKGDTGSEDNVWVCRRLSGSVMSRQDWCNKHRESQLRQVLRIRLQPDGQGRLGHELLERGGDLHLVGKEVPGEAGVQRGGERGPAAPSMSSY